MFLLIYSTIKIRDTTTSSTSSSAMERSFEKLSMLSAKTSVSAGHSALQNSWYRECKKKDKALVNFVLILAFKMIHVIEKKILPPLEESSTKSNPCRSSLNQKFSFRASFFKWRQNLLLYHMYRFDGEDENKVDQSLIFSFHSRCQLSCRAMMTS